MTLGVYGLMRMEASVDERDIFHKTGLLHLLNPQWSNPAEKRAVIACLVQSVYVMEKDRQLELQGTKDAMAPEWWLRFNYKLVQTIHDNESHEKAIGAVFRWSQSKAMLRPAGAPKFVVAFRGTMIFGDTLQGDLCADISLVLQKLHVSNRLTGAFDVVRQILNGADAESVCIAGHSLGASLCLIIGTSLAKEGIRIDTHLFNLPFPSFRLNDTHSSSWRAALHTFHTVAVSAIASIVQDKTSRAKGLDAFLALTTWRPHIYINSHDPICMSYVGYFMSRDYNRYKLTRPALHNSLQSLVLSFGEFRPYHLIPSAHLYVIKDKSLKKLKQAHGMQQWWSPKFQVIYHEIIFDPGEFENCSDVEDASS